MINTFGYDAVLGRPPTLKEMRAMMHARNVVAAFRSREDSRLRGVSELIWSEMFPDLARILNEAEDNVDEAVI